MQGRLSLQERLVALLLVAILPLAGLSIWFVAREVESTRELSYAQLRFAASAVSASHERTVDSVHHLLGTLAAMPLMAAPSSDNCRPILADLQRRFPVYANIGVADAGGRVVCLARGDAGPADASDRLYFRRALAQRTFVMGEAVVGRATGTYSLGFAMPVLRDGAVTAVVFAALDLRQAASRFGNLALPPGARVTLADARAQAVMVFPPHPGRRQGERMGPPPLVSAAAAMQPATGRLVDDEGHARIFAATPTAPVGAERFLAIVTQDRSDLVRAADTRLAQALGIMCAALLGGIAAAWWLGGRIIVKPARQILGVVRRLEAGRLDARIAVDPRQPRGEFARIAAAFNLMAESLQARQAGVESELARTRSAYSVLDSVLNSMQEGLFAVGPRGQFLLVNAAASKVVPLEGEPPPPDEWPRHYGLYQPGTQEHLEPDDLPAAHALRGETGEMVMSVRNARVPEGRLLRCNYSPLSDGERITGALVVFTDLTDLDRAESDVVLLRNAVARLNDIVMITTATPLEAPGPTIVFVNEAFERLTGYTAAEAIGNTPRMLHGPGTDPAALERIRAAFRGYQPIREELLHYTRKGEPLWLEVDVVPLADEAGRFTHFIAVQRDITARKQFEQQLQEFSAMLQRAAEAAQRIARHQPLEQTLRAVVEQARLVVGARHASLSLADGTHVHAGEPEDGEVLAVALQDGAGAAVGTLQLAGKEHGNFGAHEEHVAVELAQIARIAIENGMLFEQVREMNASLEDRIAERTSELVRQGRLYRTLAEQLPEIVWNTDATGTLTYVNRAFYELVGGSDTDWLGKTGIGAVHPDDREAVAANWLECMRTLATFSGIRRLLGADGRYHTMSYRGAPVFGDDGHVSGWVGIDADITEIKTIEEALRASNEELEAFSYSVSHDLRAPLGAIGGFSQALAERLQGHGDEKAQHYLTRIGASVRKMEQLIEALLGLSRVAREPLQKADVDVTALAREAVEALQQRDPGRHVDVDVAPGLVARGDSRLLRVLIDNLVGNAWKFSARNEAARIAVGRTPDGAFFVRDNGVGFDMAYAGKLFSAFQRLHTEQEFPGTGIGLATVRRIVARHGGRVWAESEPGAGTTFFFTLGD